MMWEKALDLVVRRTGHDRYRELCDESYPQHAAWRDRVVLKASEIQADAGEYPPMAVQAANAAIALGRIAGAIAANAPLMVPEEVLQERQAACESCPKYDACARRCRLCGCWTQTKQRLATEACPDNPPRWGVWEKAK